MTNVSKTGSRLLAVLLALLLASVPFALLGSTHTAYADEVDDAQAAADDAEAAVNDAQAVLDDAEAQMRQISGDCDALAAEIDDLQADIDDLTDQVLDAQDAMLAGRESLGEFATYEYRSNTMSMLLSVFLESKSFSDLLQNVEYVTIFMQYYADEVQAQKERKEEFENLSSQLSEEKDTQEASLSELESKRSAAQQVVDDANSKLSSAKSNWSSRLEELQAQAERFANQTTDSDVAIAEDATTVDREDAVPADTPVVEDPASTAASTSEPAAGSSGGGSSSSSGSEPAQSSGSGSGGGATASPAAPDTGDASAGWRSGVASAYGGSTDPGTPNPGITATGAICNDSSMGVAIPMPMPNYRSYFGRTVEISYGGMTVYAVVNDCGYMGGGSRVLDLQPGVFKAFGFSSCSAWGLRVVSYRFL